MPAANDHDATAKPTNLPARRWLQSALATMPPGNSIREECRRALERDVATFQEFGSGNSPRHG
jgi:hypothetical protein